VNDDDDGNEDEKFTLQKSIGDRLKAELDVASYDDLPTEIAERLRLLHLKESDRLNGHAH
jgi:hypothetical protein